MQTGKPSFFLAIEEDSAAEQGVKGQLSGPARQVGLVAFGHGAANGGCRQGTP